MRFDDMVLSHAQLKADIRNPSLAQHEADMAAEVTCPLIGWDKAGPATLCPLCSGVGRVTLGRIVEASRAGGKP